MKIAIALFCALSYVVLILHAFLYYYAGDGTGWPGYAYVAQTFVINTLFIVQLWFLLQVDLLHFCKLDLGHRSPHTDNGFKILYFFYFESLDSNRT